jgi:ribosomal protein L17
MVKFGRYYDKTTSQSDFGWDIDRYRDIKKKLINFEKSILEPRKLSLSDDLEMIKAQLESEKAEFENKKEELNNEENKNKLIEKYSKEIIELNRKKKPLSERVKAFASLNNKCLTEMLQYEVEQKTSIEAFETQKEVEKIIESEKQAEISEQNEYVEAIETLEMLLDLADNKKEKEEIKEAIETIKMLNELI